MLHALETVRSGMPSARHAVYLNAGTWGPLPTRAADAMRARVDSVESHGRIGSTGYAEFSRIREGARAAFAESVSSDPERIALTHSTSGGMNLVLGGLAFAPGDEIVTTDNEHPGLLEPLAALTRRYGVVVRVAEALNGSDPLDAVAALIGPRTRLVALSHVLWANGRVLPLRAISAAAHAAGAPVLVDGAQGVGAIDVDPAALDVDAYAGTGQKWLCGPNGVGFLWVADGFEERFEVAAPSYYTRDFRSEGAPFWPGARRHDGASLATAGLAGLTSAVDFRRQLVGWSEGAIEMAGVRARCVALLSEVPGVTLQAESEGAAPLVAFTVEGKAADEVVEGLETAGVLARTLPGLDWVRVSLGYWVSDGDLDRLAAALRPA
ncbi:MAG: aminotransferase class V-fold PLP-dependent enzyme [Actinomycetota bacterium]|nr:aminotransferase class V-fold PLP-dependent enzyme [Actinomycetota bacterium]